jgi:hypothetical protein
LIKEALEALHLNQNEKGETWFHAPNLLWKLDARIMVTCIGRASEG